MLLFGWAMQAQAQLTTIYGNSAINGTNPIHIIDGTTGVESTRYYGNPGGNGRGIVVVGDVIYYTIVGDSHIYELDRNTGNPIGSIQTQNSSMSTIAWDGSTFWTTDYAGTNTGFQIDPVTGNNLKTVTFSQAGRYMDGMEFFDDKLIVNRGDAVGTYDIYDLDGNLLQDSFITTPNGSGTGIAYDGTNFLVSDIYNSKIGVYDGTTGSFLNWIDLTSPYDSYFLIEDLSVDYEQRSDTGHPGGGSEIPAPAAVILATLGMGLVGRMRRSKML